MITAQVQIHGYNKGHQLLASSVILSKDDQSVVDRLSDVAGPLRPREQFSPYLSAYPVPSGKYYVVARTWQDLTVPRSGCVKTQSVLVDAEKWAYNPPLLPIVRQLYSSELPSEMDAVCLELDEQQEMLLPPALDFSASELLEALFLEDVKPVVVFDAPNPELIALRLLSALWPNIRRRFALSTFALSPRKIRGRDFDLVFAPSNAKAKYSDWLGRRVDGRLSQSDRHRWTSTIVRRVFEEPVPRLLSDRELNLLGDRDADSAAALRIALLWDELLKKLERTPTAALGLLDIANSGLVSNKAAVRSLDSKVAEATRHAASNLSSNDAWDFVGALSQKMQGYDMPAGKMAVEQLAAYLAEQAPDSAITFLRQPALSGSNDGLTSSIAIGLGKGAAPRIEDVLAKAPLEILARLVSQGGTLTSRVAQDNELIGRIGAAFTSVDRELADKASKKLLPFLIEDRQLAAALPIFDKLDSRGVQDELAWLGKANAFRAELLCAALIDRAREIGGLSAVRSLLISTEASSRRDELLERTISPIRSDVRWILEEKRLSKAEVTALLVSVLRRSEDYELTELLSDHLIGERIVELLPADALDILQRAALLENLPINTQLRVIQSVIPQVDATQRFEIAKQSIGRYFRHRFDGDEVSFLLLLIDILGGQLNGEWAARAGLERGTDSSIASRNLVVFDKASPSARAEMVDAVDEIAKALYGRHTIDLDETASDACARLMFDAENTSPKALINAAGRLIPSLLLARRQPVSLLVAALFPIVYRNIPKADAALSLLRFTPGLEWDRRKAARRELVNAFILSSWRPGDLALTACRCDDVEKILKRVANSYGGEAYLLRIENDLDRLIVRDRRIIMSTISEIRADTSYKFDW